MGHYMSKSMWWMILGMVVLVASQPAVGQQEQVAVCHRPSGNPSNFRIIRVAPNAVAEHIAHGDNLVEPEVCDGIDNECDGVVDNDLQNLGTCTVGQGVCAMTAPMECQEGSPVCTAVEGTPVETTEVSCDDELDNDCDGVTDVEDPDCAPQGCPCEGTSFGGVTWDNTFETAHCFNLGTSFYVAGEFDPSEDEYHQLRIHSNGTACDIRLSTFDDSADMPLTPTQREACVQSITQIASDDGVSCPPSPY